MFRLNKVQSDPCCQAIDNTSFTAPCWASYSTFGDDVRNETGQETRENPREKNYGEINFLQIILLSITTVYTISDRGNLSK